MRMAQTLEAIGDRLSPERVVERRKAAVKQRFRRVREGVMGSPAYVEPTARAARDQAASAASSAADAARTMAEKVQDVPGQLADTTAGNPLAAGLVALGTGLLLATVFPKTQTEQQLLDGVQPQIERFGDELRDAGQRLSGDVRDEAKHAIERTTSSGKEAVSVVADEARSSVQSVAEQARQQNA